MFRAFMCPSSGEKLLYLCDTGICHSVWVAYGLLVGFSIQPADQTPPILIENTSVVQVQQFSTDDGHMNARNMYRREINKYMKQNCAPRWIYLRGC